MIKVDISAFLSNLLVLSAVVFAVAPIVLGDQLILIGFSVLRESTIMIQQFSYYLQSFAS